MVKAHQDVKCAIIVIEQKQVPVTIIDFFEIGGWLLNSCPFLEIILW